MIDLISIRKLYSDGLMVLGFDDIEFNSKGMLFGLELWVFGFGLWVLGYGFWVLGAWKCVMGD